jgi:hypothetical protein
VGAFEAAATVAILVGCIGDERFLDDSLGEKRQCEGERLVVEKNETRDLATGQENSSRLLLYNVYHVLQALFTQQCTMKPPNVNNRCRGS